MTVKSCQVPVDREVDVDTRTWEDRRVCEWKKEETRRNEVLQINKRTRLLKLKEKQKEDRLIGNS